MRTPASRWSTNPPGWLVTSGPEYGPGTLVNALLHRLGPLDTGDPARPGIVHRIDKPTSGLLVVARDTASHRELARQFKEREVHKEYLALVYGTPSPCRGRSTSLSAATRSTARRYPLVRATPVRRHPLRGAGIVRRAIPVEDQDRNGQDAPDPRSHGEHRARGCGSSVYGIGRDRNLPLLTGHNVAAVRTGISCTPTASRSIIPGRVSG